MEYNRLIPELTVSDITKTKQFYVDILGFWLEYERKEDKFIFVSLEGSQLMFEEKLRKWSILLVEESTFRLKWTI